jgi:hypothetical protein
MNFYINLLNIWKDSQNEKSAHRNASTYTGQHKHKKKRIDIYAPKDIRTVSERLERQHSLYLAAIVTW